MNEGSNGLSINHGYMPIIIGKPTENLAMNKFVKKCIVYSTVYSLSAGGIPFARAQELPTNPAAGFNIFQGPSTLTTIGAALNVGTNMYSNLMAQQAQQAMQRAMQAQQARMMGSLTPPVLRSELFPQCPFPTFPNPMPQECPEVSVGAQSPIQTVAPVVGQHAGIAGALKFHKKNIEALLLPDNAASPFKCFDDAAENIDLQFKANVEQMEGLKTQIKVQTEKIIAQMDLQKKRVKNIHQQLNGGGEGELANQANPISDLFKNDACGIALNQDALNSNRGGLLGVDNLLNGGGNGGSVNNKAGNFIRNSKKIEKDLKKVTATIRDRLLEFTSENQEFQRGETDLASDIQDALALSKVGLTGLTQFGGLEQAMKEQSAVLQTKMKRAGTFRDINDFEDQFISNCITGNDGSGNGLSASNIIKGLDVPESLGGGNRREDMESALKNALSAKGDENTPDHVAKLAAINDFENAFPGTQIRFRDTTTSRELRESPKQLFARASNNCQRHFNNAPNGKRELEDIRRNNARLIKSQKDFILNSPDAIFDAIMKCDDNPDGGNPGSCAGGAAFDTKSPTFCFPAANKCAGLVKQCDQKVKNVIKKKQRELAVEADKYNQQYQGLLRTQNSLLNLVNQSVNQSRNLLTGLTKKLGKAPKDLFVATPKLDPNSFGVELLGDGKLPDINELPKKIDEIKKKLEGHLKDAQAEIKKERETVTKRLQSIVKEFDKVAESCQKNVDNLKKATDQLAQKQQQQIEEALKKQAEMNQKISGLCAKAKNLFSGGSEKPTCNNAAQSLAEEISEITVELNPTLKAVAGTIHATCGDSDSESGKPGATFTLSGLCQKNTNTPFKDLEDDELAIIKSESKTKIVPEKKSENSSMCNDLLSQANIKSGCSATIQSPGGGKAWFKMGASDIETSTGTSQDKETKGTTCDKDKFLSALESPKEELQSLQAAYSVAKSGKISGDLSKIGEILNGGTCEGQARSARAGAESQLGQLQRQPQVPGGLTSGGI